ncbi:amino acid ABC transporter permease [Helicobacter sp. T3_23-1056]
MDIWTTFETLFTLPTLQRLGLGLFVSFYLAFVSISLSIALGSVVGLAMMSRFWILRGAMKIYLESMRIIPVLALLYVLYFGLPQILSLSIANYAVAIIAFSLWGSAEMGDLVRGALESIDRHYRQSALALGFTTLQIQVFIIFPLAFKRLLPNLINLFTRMIKTTSLVLFIGISDILQVGRQIIEANRALLEAPFIIYGLILCLYFALCYPLSLIAKKLESKAC